MRDYCEWCRRVEAFCTCEPCGHPGCNERRAGSHLMFCEDHLVGELTVEPVERPTTEDLAAEHDEVLAEVSEALAIWDRETDDAMDEHWHAGEAQKLVSAHRKRAQIHEGKARQALDSLSPAAREQLEARRVVVLDGTTYVVDAIGDELQLLVSDPWVIS